MTDIKQKLKVFIMNKKRYITVTYSEIDYKVNVKKRKRRSKNKKNKIRKILSENKIKEI